MKNHTVRVIIMKSLKKIISVFLCAALCVSAFAVSAQAKSAKKYVKSISIQKKTTITIPTNKKTAVKSFKVTVKVKGGASKKFTAISGNAPVAAVKVVKSTIKVTAKKAGIAKITVISKAKNKKGNKLSKALTVTVKKAAEKKNEEEKEDDFKIYFANNKKWTSVNARFFNRKTGDSFTPEMKFLEKNSYGEDVYCAAFDLAKYDRVVFGNGTDVTTDIPVTKASSGFYITSDEAEFNGKYSAGVYTYGKQFAGKIDDIEMDYPGGYKKTVSIMTPEGYNPKDKTKKYSVLYMSDAQNIFGMEGYRSKGEWSCDETVQTLMNNGGDGIIIVGVITNDEKRMTELTPNIGSLKPIPEVPEEYYKNAKLEGENFSKFIAEDLIPYIDKNYNTNSIRGFAGSSNGGLEAFYIGVEHPELFSYIGAMSPSFDFFDEDVWNNYLADKKFTGSVPYLYISAGNSDFTEQIQYNAIVSMGDRLTKAGYPADKMSMVLDQDAAHKEFYWAIYFPEMLCCGLNI